MRQFVLVAVPILVFLAILSIVQPGNLEPPGPPAPTMKTLDEVRPGTPIRSNDLANPITVSGYYYLASDVSVLDATIDIQADHVTLDLMGHTLEATGSIGEQSGIVANGVDGLTLTNGRIIGNWGIGIENSVGVTLDGLDVSVDGRWAETVDSSAAPVYLGADDVEVRRCRLSSGSAGSIYTLEIEGSNALILGNRFSGEIGGIASGVGAAVIDNVFHSICDFPPSVCLAIWAADGSTIRGNTVTGIYDQGIDASSGSLVSENLVSGLASNFGGLPAVDVSGSRTVITDNVLTNNSGIGLFLSGSGHVYRGNVSRGNLTPSPCPGSNPDFCDFGSGNTSAGDNFMPSQM